VLELLHVADMGDDDVSEAHAVSSFMVEVIGELLCIYDIQF
jgi:hypothetical protein